MGEIIPYREVASVGVITDIEPFALPLGAWSWGANVRFRNRSITRAPVFRTAKTSLLNTGPRFLTSNIPSSGFDTLFIGYLNGRVTTLSNGIETDASIVGYVNANSEGVYTACHLADVLYINRPDRSPWSFAPGASQFTTLANWAPVSSPWTANILRSCNGALVALGVTQNGVSKPTTVITSEFVQNDGSVPTTWDYTLGTNNAVRLSLDKMEGPITDAQDLGDQLIIYGLNETWRMFLTGDGNIWGAKPLFSDVGAINANCAVEVDRKHFVFGLNDIWMHDGNSKMSISDQKVREFIFGGLSVTNASRCRVVHNKNLKEIYFQFMSQDAFTTAGGFPMVDGCNRQATYHVPTGTWSFDDLPYIFGATMGNVSTSVTWNADTRTWDTSGGTWASLDDSIRKVMVMIGDANATAGLTEKVYAYDLEGPGSVTALAQDTFATKPWTLQRDGIDLKELKKDLRGYAVISSIFPQMVLEAGSPPINFTFGTSDYYGVASQVVGTQTYDGLTLYKLDFNAGGRYFMLSITSSDYHWMNFTGIDLDVDIVAEF